MNQAVDPETTFEQQLPKMEVHHVLLDQFLEMVTEEIVRRVEAKLAARSIATTNDPSLEETLSRVLQSAAWFKSLARTLVEELDFTHEIKSAVKSFDFTDTVQSCVDDADFDTKFKDYLERRVVIAATLEQK